MSLSSEPKLPSERRFGTLFVLVFALLGAWGQYKGWTTTASIGWFVAAFPAAPRLVAGVVPPASYALVPAGTVAAFLGQAGLTPPAAAPKTGAGTLGGAAASLSGAVVAVTCQP